MPTYPVNAHPLLSPAASRLELPQLDAQTDMAEALLDAALAQRGYGRLSQGGFTVDSTEYSRAEAAVAVQVNHQVEAGVEADVYESQGRGDRQATFRSAAISPRALAIAMMLVAAPGTMSWPIAGGLR